MPAFPGQKVAQEKGIWITYIFLDFNPYYQNLTLPSLKAHNPQHGRGENLQFSKLRQKLQRCIFDQTSLWYSIDLSQSCR